MLVITSLFVPFVDITQVNQEYPLTKSAGTSWVLNKYACIKLPYESTPPLVLLMFELLTDGALPPQPENDKYEFNC